MEMNREWGFPSKETFSIPPIKRWLERHVDGFETIVDPFARDSKVGNVTNDLDPSTDAWYHMKALDFLGMLAADEVEADVLIWDPPYSSTQAKQRSSAGGTRNGRTD